MHIIPQYYIRLTVSCRHRRSCDWPFIRARSSCQPCSRRAWDHSRGRAAAASLDRANRHFDPDRPRNKLCGDHRACVFGVCARRRFCETFALPPQNFPNIIQNSPVRWMDDVFKRNTRGRIHELITKHLPFLCVELIPRWQLSLKA